MICRLPRKRSHVLACDSSELTTFRPFLDFVLVSISAAVALPTSGLLRTGLEYSLLGKSDDLSGVASFRQNFDRKAEIVRRVENR